MSVSKVHIVDRETGRPVQVELHDDLKADVLLDLEGQWRPARMGILEKLRQLGPAALAARPQSLLWDWGAKSVFLTFGNPGDFRLMAVRSRADWEAVVLTRAAGHVAELAPVAQQPLIYVDFLEVAPWNWPVNQVQNRRYKAVGPLLLRAAVEESYAKGWKGRTGLHALPQAVSFYQRAGFQFVRNDPAKQNLPYYELSEAAAQTYTERRGGNHDT